MESITAAEDGKLIEFWQVFTRKALSGGEFAPSPKTKKPVLQTDGRKDVVCDMFSRR
jgi:hypothetical protein